jgi:stalled ribosome rescue protein Dom34
MSFTHSSTPQISIIDRIDSSDLCCTFVSKALVFLLLNSVCYGFDHVKYANDQSAIETMMITDEVLRNKDFSKRQKYVDIVELAEKKKVN